MTIGTKIAAAFLMAQQEMGNATKDATNPFFKSKYADLNSVREACLPALNRHGISVLQPTIQIENRNYVKTILLHESGETIESLTEILFAKHSDPQAQGSGITYARRYGLQSLVNIGAEDDDGNEAAKKPANENKQKVAREKSEKKFAEIKKRIEECGSFGEIEGYLEGERESVSYLENNQKDLHKMLIECKDAMKEQFANESENIDKFNEATQ